jgi:GTPase SAR1 family protein
MAKASRILVIGLPGAGKTTFIAALWHLLSTERIEGALTLGELQPDRAHLNGIAKLWRECKKIPRTTLPKERTVTLNVQVPEVHALHQISFPDASGEGIRRIFENRKWSPEFANLVEEANSLLFFIHPSSLVGAHRIDEDLEQMAETVDLPQSDVKLEDDGTGVQTSDNQASAKLQDKPERPSVKPWATALAAPQAKLVDLLQIVHAARGNNGLRTSIIISAWDLAKLEKLHPQQWVEKRAPLLYQYLESGRTTFPYEIFGVSAQGGDLTSCDSLRNMVQPSERIEVAYGKNSSHDITKPLRWILE